MQSCCISFDAGASPYLVLRKVDEAQGVGGIELQWGCGWGWSRGGGSRGRGREGGDSECQCSWRGRRILLCLQYRERFSILGWGGGILFKMVDWPDWPL